jgi:hypothetical protein
MVRPWRSASSYHWLRYSSLGAGPVDRQTNVLAALIGGMLYWAQAAANAFPGVAWTDPEFLKPGESLTEFPPQLYIDIGMSVVVLFAAWLAWPRTAEAPD